MVKKTFETIIYPKMKNYVEMQSIYKPKVTKKQTQESKIFPIVPIRLLPIENSYNNLSYSEETYSFGIDINVYAQDKTIDNLKVSKKTICDEITEKIIEFYKTNYHVTIRVEYDIPNIDSNIHRNNIRITGKLDTKYGLNKLVIYPR